MKKLLFFLALMLLAAADAGASFKVGNLYYTTISETAVCVVYEDGSTNTATHYSNLSGMVTIPPSINYNGKTYQVEAIGNFTFYKSPNITGFNLPNTIKTIGTAAFSRLPRLFEFTMPNSVTRIGESCFSYCTSLINLNLSTSLTEIPSTAFRSCESLQMLAIPEGVTLIGTDAFRGCTNLRSVWIYGETLVQINYRVFEGCMSLSSINFPKSVERVGGMIMDGTPWWDSKANGLVYVGSAAYKYKGEMPDGTDISIQSGTKGIGSECFKDCSGLKSVNIPNSVTVIGQSSFEGCTGLKSVSIPNSVTSFWGYGSFKGCTGLTTVTLPNGLTSITSEAFRGCASLKSINIPNSVETIGSHAFEGCASLTSLPISNSVKTIESQAYANCTGLTSVVIPNSVKTLYGGIFSGCTALKSLTIPSSINSLYYTFSEFVKGCTSLKTLEIDNEKLANIGFFSDVKEIIETLKLGNSIYTIPENAFNGCTALKKVTLPNDFITVGKSAFSGCTKLEHVYSLRPRPIPIDATVFTGVQYDKCQLHVPSGCKEHYQEMDVWKEFRNIAGDAGSSGGSGSGVRGDVDGNSQVDVADVNTLINIILGKE